MSARAAALELLGDQGAALEQRLRDVPPAAAARGLYLRSVERTLEDHGRLGEYRRVFGPGRPPTVGFVPLHEILPRLAVGGAILESPARLHVGLQELGRRNAQAVTRSLLGRTLLRIASPDPVRMLKQGVVAQRQTTNYGAWEFELRSPGHAVMRFRDEYVWIDSYLVGAARGTFEMIGVGGEVHCELTDPFNGVHALRW